MASLLNRLPAQAGRQSTHHQAASQFHPQPPPCQFQLQPSSSVQSSNSLLSSCQPEQLHRCGAGSGSTAPHLPVRGRQRCRVQAGNNSSTSSTPQISDLDLRHLAEAATLADSSVGLTQPHPNAACILVRPDGQKIASTFQRASGTISAEAQAVKLAGEQCRGSTAYLNLETGDCHGETAALEALIQSGVSRVVVGIRHPLLHLRSKAIKSLQSQGIQVDVLGETPSHCDPAQQQEVLESCLRVNEALLHRAALRRPLSVLKYAMTLDGKIATSTGHSAWVSSTQSRAMVFEQRGRSDAVIVGGNTVRRDNPRLTTRRDGGHAPVRIVMSRTLDLPEDANLWDVTSAPTIVLTQRGARSRFQAQLRDRGVEVVEFDFLTPENVADYCYERGFLQCLWECGGTLAAPTISSGVIHKVMAFVAPKIIGGVRAPTPVGDLGFVEMTQAVELVDAAWQMAGPDIMMTGYLPSSGGLFALEAILSDRERNAPQASASSHPQRASSPDTRRPSASSTTNAEASAISHKLRRGISVATAAGKVAQFYKAWDQWGSLSNFSPHPIIMPEPGSSSNGTSQAPATREWKSVEHYYQASKFACVASEEAAAVREQIAAAESPEEAARVGRRMERTRPDLIRADWSTAKVSVMREALMAKFSRHAGPRAMLLSTAKADGDHGSSGYELVEASPHDYYWGQGYDKTGLNHLGRLLMNVRDELLQQDQQQQQQPAMAALR